jgi:hypothetical protein
MRAPRQQPSGQQPSTKEQGFVLIAMSLAMVLLLAFIGLAFDFGRLYIARNEAQVYTDAAALTAASRLDGTLDGVRKARTAVEHLPGSWNLGTQPFKGIVVEFSPDGSTWTETPEKSGSAGPWTFARVSAPSNDLGIIFLRAAGGPQTIRVLSHSAAQTNPVRLVE